MPEYVIIDSETEKQRCKTYKTRLISSRFCFETMKPILSRFLFDAIGQKAFPYFLRHRQKKA